MTTFTVTCVVILMTYAGVSAVCDRESGVSGTVDCIVIPRYYFEAQWATCLTDRYIKYKSKGTHRCEDGTAKYCYYQCMLEVFDKDDGSVFSNCSCDPSDVTPTTLAPNDVTLPTRCFSPNGTDCGWYQDCLDRKFNCSGGADDYGVAFAEQYCRLYDRSYGDFSQLGQEWVDAVRKCLQVELVPLLRPFHTSSSCADVKTRGLRSHAGCYVTPFRGANSVCDLPDNDFWKILWTVKKAFQEEFVESVLGMMKVLRQCQNNTASEDVVDYMLKMVISVPLPSSLQYGVAQRTKRQASHTDYFISGGGRFNSKLHGPTGRAPNLERKEFSSVRSSPSYRTYDEFRHNPLVEELQFSEPTADRDSKSYSSPFDYRFHGEKLRQKRPLKNRQPLQANRRRQVSVDDSPQSYRQSKQLHISDSVAPDDQYYRDVQQNRQGNQLQSLEGPASLPRSRRAAPTPWQGESAEELYYHQAAAEVAKELAKQQGWESKGILWFAYGEHQEDALPYVTVPHDNTGQQHRKNPVRHHHNNTRRHHHRNNTKHHPPNSPVQHHLHENTTQPLREKRLRIHILIADKALNSSSSSVDLPSIVREAADAYQKGEIRFSVRGTELPAGKLNWCRDQDCKQTFLEVTATSGVLPVQPGWVVYTFFLCSIYCGFQIS